MKKFIILLTVLAGLTLASAQPAPSQQSAEKKIAQPSPETTVLQQEQKPAQAKVRKFTWGGSVVCAFKAGNPLQLINPFAPSNYGPGTNGIAGATNRNDGWKLVSLSW